MVPSPNQHVGDNMILSPTIHMEDGRHHGQHQHQQHGSSPRKRNSNGDHPLTSWLSGLGLGNNNNGGGPASPGRRFGLGPLASPGRTSCNNNNNNPATAAAAYYSPSSRRHSIADDIRNDQELFFADDEPMPPLPLQPTTTASNTAVIASSSTSNTNLSRHQAEPPQRLSRSTSISGHLPRHTSQQKMDNLQREVDAALEFFSQENGESNDDLRSLRSEKYQRVEGYGGKVQFGQMMLSPSPGEEEYNSSDYSYCGGCPEGYEGGGTAATSMATSVTTEYGDHCYGSSSRAATPPPLSTMASTTTSTTTGQRRGATTTGGLSMKHKTKSIISLPLSLLPNQTQLNCADEDNNDDNMMFENAISDELNKIHFMDTDNGDDNGDEDYQYQSRRRNCNFSVDFNSNASLRGAMEPFLAVARLQREAARQNVFDILDEVMMPQEPREELVATRRGSTTSEFGFHIGSTYGVPYPALRNESSFLYDNDSFPLAEILSETLGVPDLSKIHIDNPLIKDKARLMEPLKNRGKRRKFHQCFDSFVTSQVIPLLHSQALAKGVFYTNRHQLQKGKPQSIIYRYQAFPSINIVRPGECSTDPHCDMAQGHSIGNISYHIPLTATFGTNAVYTESRPGREDWHPLVTKSPGLGFQYDGARCLHFNLKNETDITRVSLNFRIAITRAPDLHGDGIAYDPDDQLCCPELLKDKFLLDNPGFYDEVVVNVGDTPRSFMPGPVATKRRGFGISVIG